MQIFIVRAAALWLEYPFLFKFHMDTNQPGICFLSWQVPCFFDLQTLTLKPSDFGNVRVKVRQRPESEVGMIDFIIVGMLYISVMFVVCFVLSFVTIGITYTMAQFAKRFLYKFRAPHPVLK